MMTERRRRRRRRRQRPSIACVSIWSRRFTPWCRRAHLCATGMQLHGAPIRRQVAGALHRPLEAAQPLWHPCRLAQLFALRTSQRGQRLFGFQSNASSRQRMHARHFSDALACVRLACCGFQIASSVCCWCFPPVLFGRCFPVAGCSHVYCVVIRPHAGRFRC